MDDYSHGVWVYLLKEKIETYAKFVSFCSLVRNQFGTTIQRMRSDNGIEFENRPLPIYLSKEGIIHETICVDTPEQNGRVERKNRLYLILLVL